MRLRFEPRPAPSRVAQVLAPVAAIGLTVVFGSVFFLILELEPIETLHYLVRGPWRDPFGFNFPQTALFGSSALFDPLVGAYRVNTSIFITLVAAGVAWVFIQHTFTSYRMTVGGAAPAAARFAGFRESRSVWLGLLVGGGCAGLAGMMEVAGPLGQLTGHISPGYGFAAIIVAFVGRLHPFGIVLGGLLLSLSGSSGRTRRRRMTSGSRGSRFATSRRSSCSSSSRGTARPRWSVSPPRSRSHSAPAIERAGRASLRPCEGSAAESMAQSSLSAMSNHAP